MLASNDLKEIASMIDPNQESTPIMGQTVDVDVNNLDYGYISKCQSTREIKQLLDYLKFDYEITPDQAFLEVEKKGLIPSWSCLCNSVWQSWIQIDIRKIYSWSLFSSFIECHFLRGNYIKLKKK